MIDALVVAANLISPRLAEGGILVEKPVRTHIGKTNLSSLTAELQRHQIVNLRALREHYCVTPGGADVQARTDRTSLVSERLIQDLVYWQAHQKTGEQVTAERLVALWQEEDDDGLLPTSYSFSRTWELVIGAARHLSTGLPKGWPSLGHDGGIRIEWLDGSRQIRLIVPPNETGREYIYFQEGDNHAVEARVSPAILAGWLRWLTGD